MAAITAQRLEGREERLRSLDGEGTVDGERDEAFAELAAMIDGAPRIVSAPTHRSAPDLAAERRAATSGGIRALLHPSHTPIRPPRASRVPLRRPGAQGRRCRQRRNPRLDRALARQERERPGLPADQGGAGLGARPHLGRGACATLPGASVVEGQRMMQAASDGLRWATIRARRASTASRATLCRQLSAGIGIWPRESPADSSLSAQACRAGRWRACAHQGDRIAIASFLGRNRRLRPARRRLRDAYVSPQPRDHAALGKADVDSGRVRGREPDGACLDRIGTTQPVRRPAAAQWAGDAASCDGVCQPDRERWPRTLPSPWVDPRPSVCSAATADHPI